MDRTTRQTVATQRDEAAMLRDALAAHQELLAAKNRRLGEMYQSAHQFIDNVSSKFRSPLSAITEFTSLVRDGLAGPLTDRQQQFLDAVLSRTDEMTSIVDDMLDISRLEVGLVKAHRRPTDVGAIFDRVRQHLQRRNYAQQVDLQLDVDDGLPTAYCDANLIHRAIVNLVTNAIRYSPAGGVVRLWSKASQDGPNVTIGVTDGGPGIEQDELLEILALFQQARVSIHSGTKGFGPGLGIARELVRLNLGEFLVESRPSAGSSIGFTLPICDANAIFQSYLNHLSALDACHGYVSLITVCAEPADDRSAHAQVDQFLHQNVRPHDLVWATGRSSWLCALLAPQLEVDQFVQRIGQTWTQWRGEGISPGCPLPKLEFIDTWQIDDQRDSLTAAFLAACERSEASMTRIPRVLVIEDDPQTAQGLSLRLRSAGYDVITTENHQQVIAEVASHQPDAIVLDECRHASQGLATLQKLKQRQETKNTPVIMLSTSVRDQQRALEDGVRVLLEKPYDSREIVRAVRSSLAKEPLPCD